MRVTTVDSKPLRTNQGKNAVLWILQLGGAAMFFTAGLPKLSADEQMVQVFDVIGLGQWFRYVTGAIEVVSAVLLLIPSTAGIGALLLIPTMIGATLTVIFIIGGSPAIPIGLLIVMAVIAWGRWEKTLRLFGKL